MAVPVAFGNQDPEWRAANQAQQPNVILVEADAYPNSNSRKCVWAMLLVSTLLVLHVQRDRYADSLHWHGGIADHGAPLPWEVQALVASNDSYEAAFLAPSLLRASTFVQAAGSPLAVNGFTHNVFSGDGFRQTSQQGEGGQDATEHRAPGGPTPGVSSVVIGAQLLSEACGERGCFAGVQRAMNKASSVRQLPGASTCHRFVTGDSLSSLRPVSQGGGLLCLRSKRIYAALAVLTGNRSQAVVAWDPSKGGVRIGTSGRPYSCLARVAFPSMQFISSIPVDFASTVLYDRATSSIITLGFSAGVQNIVADQYDAATFKPMLRYSLPISVAWFLHAPKMSDGFLLFLGSEPPFVGCIFAIDLRRQMLYQQDPPAGPHMQRPRRWVLPYNKFVERLPSSDVLSASDSQAAMGHLGVSVASPCAAASVDDLGDS
eukprot:TRINITY_DN53998_c0_g1_i1.p1 TRINITY_DN53998_c0_g1~~TRINITY_DN53998_c0_g1_i1.p1  ORF type:complete len:459 (-),score=82.72 TRINITY_DN53998_c0_g1_i1:59-1354(-)